jgi:hypothetical protein
MLSSLLHLFAQAQQPAQGDYWQAYGLVAAMVLLGVLVVCIPRLRKKHFVEPEDLGDVKKKKVKKKLPKRA